MSHRKRNISLDLEALEDRKLLDASYDFAWTAANTNADHITTSPTLQKIEFSVTNTNAVEGKFGVADGKIAAEREASGSNPGGVVVPALTTVVFDQTLVPGVSYHSFWVAGQPGMSTHIFVDDTPAPPVQNATSVNWANPADITYGTLLGPTQLNATASSIGLVGNVPGTFTYTPPAGTKLSAGANQPLNVLFTPTDLVNYAPSSGTVHINVLKANPTVTWPEPADITAGTHLSDVQLDAYANVPGTFAYTPNVGVVLPVGQDQLLSTVFTPTDTANYNTVTKTTLIDVNPTNVPNPNPNPPQPPSWWNWNPWNWWNQPPVQTSVRLFDEAYYLQHNPDVAAAVGRNEFPSGYDHFLRFGLAEGRIGTPDWTPSVEAKYLAANPDVANAVNFHLYNNQFQTGYEHFVTYGQFEHRPGTPIVIPQAVVHLGDQFSSPDWTPTIEVNYLTSNPDVNHAVQLGQFPSGYNHFFLYGRHEFRPGAPLVA